MANGKKTTSTPPTPTPAAEPAPVEETAIQAPDNSTKALASFDFGEFEGLGIDSLSTRLIQIPYLVLVQPGTKGVTDPGSPLFGKAGNFWNPLTGEFHKELEAAFIKIDEEYIEREPIPGGSSKMVAKHFPGSEFVELSFKRTEAARAKGLDKVSEEGRKRYGFGKLVDPNDKNIVVETYAAMAVFRDTKTGSTFGAIFGFKSAGIPAVKGWTTGVRSNRELPNGTTVQAGKIPLVANRVKLLPEYRERPNAHFAAVLRPVNGNIRDSVMPMDDELTLSALESWKMVKSGKAEINEASREAGEAVGDADDRPGPEGGVVGSDGKMVF